MNRCAGMRGLTTNNDDVFGERVSLEIKVDGFERFSIQLGDYWCQVLGHNV